jgi:transcriptional regulator with XRE-family HTH domain
MDLRTRVGRNVRRLRVLAEMSQESLATDARLETMHVSRIERGIANPTLQVLARVARALDVDASQLFNPEAARLQTENLTRGRKPRRVPGKVRRRQ